MHEGLEENDGGGGLVRAVDSALDDVSALESEFPRAIDGEFREESFHGGESELGWGRQWSCCQYHGGRWSKTKIEDSKMLHDVTRRGLAVVRKIVRAKKNEGATAANMAVVSLLRMSDAPVEPPPKEADARPWDQTNRKVTIHGVIKFLDQKKAQVLADEWQKEIQEKKLGIVIERVKKVPRTTWMQVTLETEEMVQPMMDFINNDPSKCNRKGVQLKAFPRDEQSAKRKGDRDDDRNRKRQKEESRRPITDDEIKDAVVPLWRQTYEEQLDQKMKEMILQCAKKVTSEIKKRFRNVQKERGSGGELFDWLKAKRPIDLDSIVPIPHPVRNKCEFTFGYRYLFDKEKPEDGDYPRVPAVGFMATGWSGGVVKPHGCLNIPEEACALVDLVDEFLETSPLPPYDSYQHSGFWRLLTVRTSRRTKECMVVVVHAPAESGGAGDDEGFKEHFDTERSRLIDVLVKAELPVPDQEPLKVTSIFFQSFGGLSNPKPQDPVQVRWVCCPRCFLESI